MVLMFAGVKSFAINILIGLVIAILGVAWFEAGILQAGMYFLFFVVFESILEASAIIFCYGNERLPARFFHGLVLAMYLFIAAVAGLAAFLMITKEPSFSPCIGHYFLIVISHRCHGYSPCQNGHLAL